MSWCERVLADHIDCVKAFLRDARTHNLPYEPGSYGDGDRCASTRHAYVECTQDPKRKLNALSVAQPSGAGPVPCEMELNMHGKCIERFLRSALANATDYVFLTHTGVNKCLPTRDAFDKCLKGTKDLKEGKAKDLLDGPPSISTRSQGVMDRIVPGTTGR
mmetsp:Transcript_19377/g.45450  ORF Transcript_19377/g.45450 Transcript_19377/m.45450 type:complete len:161 (-) Transcript_19377:93-575(-)|eukprot:CAMPEP_0171092616 /NCGR_PEP_ID=MMETSP0766_2-20121228/36548_1 /TAXON_ID=439317 /ORGANISM="Gambierdiscus australes, Strain CAWD 149" /LENGTH=160 /DNA_ID=CAMNT_0011550893 /DNA_START=80 /DNA_END=562 /DNA_ORIENTATION=-